MAKILELHQRYYKSKLNEQPVIEAKLDLGDLVKIDSKILAQIAKLLIAKVPDAEPFTERTSVEESLLWIINNWRNFYDIAPTVSDLSKNEDGTVSIVFGYGDYAFAATLPSLAISMVGAALTHPEAVAQIVEQTLDRLDATALDISSRGIVKELNRRRIPWRRDLQGLVQVGQGNFQTAFRQSRLQAESWYSIGFATDKYASLKTFEAAGLPVGKVVIANSVKSALSASKSMGFPLVVKPINLGKGISVFPDIRDTQTLSKIATSFQAQKTNMLMQNHFPGEDHRILVIDGKFVAAAKRVPASVLGDGSSTISDLIERTNDSPNRGNGFKRMQCKILVDDEMKRTLSDQKMSLKSVPVFGQMVMLKKTANISTGGSAIDVTQIIHPDNIKMAERASRIASLKVAGVDFLTTDISKSWREVGGGICEINKAPGLRPHWIANPDRDVVSPIVDALLQDRGDGLIPTAMITGTQGKTTTSLMMAEVLRTFGHIPGVATTDGVVIGDDWIRKGDIAGTIGAKIVMADRDVTAAVLETARGGILKRGLFLDQCDVAAFLNVQREQIGMDGVDTLEDMLQVKRKVVDTATKGVVLNLDDELVASLVSDYPPERVIGYSMDQSNVLGDALVKQGGHFVTLDETQGTETIVVRSSAQSNVVATQEIPICMNAMHRANVSNALAVTGMALGLSLGPDAIADGLRNCQMTRPGEPGRMIFLPGYPFEALIDFACGAPAFAGLIPALGPKKEGQKRVGVVTTAGNRPEWFFGEFAQEIVGAYDEFICFERPNFMRGRPEGEIATKISDNLIAVGADPANVHVVPELSNAMELAKGILSPGDHMTVAGGGPEYLIEEFSKIFGPAESISKSE